GDARRMHGRCGGRTCSRSARPCEAARGARQATREMPRPVSHRGRAKHAFERGRGSGHCVIFFRAEDGIRGYRVTGVQTCALPILGVEGLDHVLAGGLQRGRVYLIEGSPGTGKTTIATQSLLAGAEKGERGLYITLSETEEELRSEERRVGKERRAAGWP